MQLSLTESQQIALLKQEGREALFAGQLVRDAKQQIHRQRVPVSLQKTLNECGAQAAQHLGLHCNTLSNRLECFETLYGRNADDPQVRFDISVALMIRRLFSCQLPRSRS